MSWKNVLSEIFPFCQLITANNKLHSKNKEIIDADSPKLSYMASYNLLSLDRVEKHYDRVLESKKVIEEKLKTSLTSLTLASSFTLAFATIVLSDGFKKQSPCVLFLVGFLLTMAVLYFITSGILAMRAMSESNMIYLLNPDDEGKADQEEKKKQALAIRAELNNNVNIIRQNYMSVSFHCIRNGLILMILIPLVLFFSNVFNKHIEEDSRVTKELNALNQTIGLGFNSIYSSGQLIKGSIDTSTAMFEKEIFNYRLMLNAEPINKALKIQQEDISEDSKH